MQCNSFRMILLGQILLSPQQIKKNVKIYLEPVITYRWCAYSLADRVGGVSGPTGRDGEVHQRVSNLSICNLSTLSKHGKRK